MQTVTMFPCHEQEGMNFTIDDGQDGRDGVPLTMEEERARRIATWQEGLHVHSYDRRWREDDPYRAYWGGERELKPVAPPALTELGERILGLREW